MLRCSRGRFLAMAVLAMNFSCILPEKCIFVYVKGVLWEAEVLGKAKDSTGAPVVVQGSSQDCKDAAADALFIEADENDPLYVAARDAMLAKATLACVENAVAEGFMDINCDPEGEDDPAMFIVGPIGECATKAKQLVHGDPTFCCIGSA